MTTLDIAIPAHNESAIIIPTLKFVSSTLAKIPDCVWRIIVVDNASTDETVTQVAEAALPNVVLLTTARRGKGAALKEAAQYSTAEYFGFIDADASPDPETFAIMLSALKQHNAALAVGSRFHQDAVTDRNILRHNSSRLFNIFARIIVGVRMNDTQCPMKLMDERGKKILQSCEDNTWFLDLELIARSEKEKLHVLVLPVNWKEFRYPERTSKLHLPKDGFRALTTMVAMKRRLAHHKK